MRLLLLLLLPLLLPAKAATQDEKLLAVLVSGENFKMAQNYDGSVDVKIFLKEESFELNLEPTERHASVSVDRVGAHLHSLEHLGISGMSGVAKLWKRGLTLAKGTASMIYDQGKSRKQCNKYVYLL